MIDKKANMNLPQQPNRGIVQRRLVIPSQVEGVPVTVIPDLAYFGNKELIEIEISEGIEVIGKLAFANCTKAKQIVMPDSAREIKTQAFMNCRSLEWIIIPAGIDRIQAGAFEGCDRLKEVYFESPCSWMIGCNQQDLSSPTKAAKLLRNANVDHDLFKLGKWGI